MNSAYDVPPSRPAPPDRTGPTSFVHLAPLLTEFTRASPGDPCRRALRDELVIGYLPVVHNIARRYHDRGESLEDLRQVGVIGLLNALDRFDPEHGSDFMSYLIPTVMGEVRRHFRDRSWAMRVPRRLKDLQHHVRGAVELLSARLERAPRPSEIAAYLDIALDDVVEALQARNAYSAEPFDATHHGGGTALGDPVDRVDRALETAEYRDNLRRALGELPDRERTILVLRFFGDLTQTQIAAQVGISQMHVSRLLGQTLRTLRDRLEASEPGGRS